MDMTPHNGLIDFAVPNNQAISIVIEVASDIITLSMMIGTILYGLT